MQLAGYSRVSDTEGSRVATRFLIFPPKCSHHSLALGNRDMFWRK